MRAPDADIEAFMASREGCALMTAQMHAAVEAVRILRPTWDAADHTFVASYMLAEVLTNLLVRCVQPAKLREVLATVADSIRDADVPHLGPAASVADDRPVPL